MSVSECLELDPVLIDITTLFSSLIVIVDFIKPLFKWSDFLVFDFGNAIDYLTFAESILKPDLAAILALEVALVLYIVVELFISFL
jgi:hypothetical protein